MDQKPAASQASGAAGSAGSPTILGSNVPGLSANPAPNTVSPFRHEPVVGDLERAAAAQQPWQEHRPERFGEHHAVRGVRPDRQPQRATQRRRRTTRPRAPQYQASDAVARPHRCRGWTTRDGRRITELANPLPTGAPLTFLLQGCLPGWVQVQLPTRPTAASAGSTPAR